MLPQALKPSSHRKCGVTCMCMIRTRHSEACHHVNVSPHPQEASIPSHYVIHITPDSVLHVPNTRNAIPHIPRSTDKPPILRNTPPQDGLLLHHRTTTPPQNHLVLQSESNSSYRRRNSSKSSPISAIGAPIIFVTKKTRHIRVPLHY